MLFPSTTSRNLTATSRRAWSGWGADAGEGSFDGYPPAPSQESSFLRDWSSWNPAWWIPQPTPPRRVDFHMEVATSVRSGRQGRPLIALHRSQADVRLESREPKRRRAGAVRVAASTNLWLMTTP